LCPFCRLNWSRYVFWMSVCLCVCTCSVLVEPFLTGLPLTLVIDCHGLFNCAAVKICVQSWANSVHTSESSLPYRQLNAFKTVSDRLLLKIFQCYFCVYSVLGCHSKDSTLVHWDLSDLKIVQLCAKAIITWGNIINLRRAAKMFIDETIITVHFPSVTVYKWDVYKSQRQKLHFQRKFPYPKSNIYGLHLQNILGVKMSNLTRSLSGSQM